MAITLEEAKRLLEQSREDGQDRHDMHRRLRNYYHGRYWIDDDDKSASSLSSLFRDMTSRRHDFGPNLRIVHNLLQEVCAKYQAFLSVLPQISVLVDQPGSSTRTQQANLKERVLYGTWAEGKMTRRMNEMAWYLPLMGDCFLGIWPDFDRSIPCPLIRSPEHAYPVQGYEGEPDVLLFSWKAPESQVKRQFPNYDPEKARPKNPRLRKLGTKSDPLVEIIEYSDKNEWARWADGQKLNGVEHKYGFNLFEQVPFIKVPDEPWNHGAVEQIVGLVEAGNALHSLTIEAILRNVFPTLFLINPSKAPEVLELGAGGVVPLQEGGDAKWLTPPTNTLQASLMMGEQLEREVKQGTAMPDVSFGQSNASVITGKAINELQGAGTGSTIEMVQGAGIGDALVSFNEKALYMYQNVFRDDSIYLQGLQPRGTTGLNPRSFGVKFKGSQIVGSYRNEVTFSPYLNQHERLVMGLQSLGANLVSKRSVRENSLGISDSEAMEEEILEERIQDMFLGAIEQEMLAAPTPQTAQSVESRGISYIEGTPAPPVVSPQGPAPQAPPMGPAGAPAGGEPSPFGPITPGAPGQIMSPALAEPPGAPLPGSGPSPQGPQSPQAQGIRLDDVANALSNVDLSGRAFLVGEIVQTGQSSGDIEIALTDQSDQQAITQALPQYSSNLVFHLVKNEPSEPHVEVGAGVAPQEPQTPAEPAPV